ncbi:MAG: acyltransferase [Thermobacillus sp. ZCTH02-B1]|uniref:carbon-nitrogen hydrolase family protein n=1 Tax=Thermobacillus sp. ZCTH02-B1 TaxID=1858795 RepID=UPI000B5761FA|nr:carbon-nitrogen hydrolase family protein [Thermobacillus sp. ZCTH02-B1]OUM94660.1 MAG: acyltransferase [Thermobacillus sp. ZCTH02-B1]
MRKGRFRVSAVQYRLGTIDSFEAFAAQSTHYVCAAQEFGADFVLFPEFFTTQLLSIGDGAGRALPIGRLPEFTDRYRALFTGLARETGMHIIAGTHIVERGGKLYNTAHLFLPDGRVLEQPKLHLTPTEVKEWKLTPGEELRVFGTEHGTIALLTCYDIEFPEIARIAKARGADVVFCPSCTDDQHGFWRVRYSCHARAVENQVYVVTAGTVGSLPTVDFMRMNYGQAAIITPNDVPFPPRGVLAEGVVGEDMIVTADLDLTLLEEVRAAGSVTTWRDRRTDLYPDWS